MTDVPAVTDFYGRWARLYDLAAGRAPGLRSLRARAAGALDLSPGDTVVEMGCGTGANLPYLRERVGPDGRVIAVDLTAGMLERARARIERAGWSNVHLVRGDAARPPAARADAVLATFVVGMLDDPAAAVGTWCELAPGGTVALLDATRSDRGLAAPVNALFAAFVRATSPPGTAARYGSSPARVLERRVAAARDALADRAEVTTDRRRALGVLWLTAGRVRGPRTPGPRG